MSKLIRHDKICQIIEADDDFIKKLDEELSFWIQGAEHSKAFRGYTNSRGEWTSWDGRKHLLTRKGYFPPGLFERVQNFYDKNNVKLEIIDERSSLKIGKPIDIIPTLEKIGQSPRPYQLEAANKAIKSERGIIRMATGSGKSMVAALITSFIGKKTIIFVIGKDLLYQFHNFFSEIFNQSIGIIGDGKCEIHDINIVTIWSVGQALGLKKNKVSLDDSTDDEKKIDASKHKSIKEMLMTSPVQLLDECHLAACDTVQEISKAIKAEYVYGMSASPWRDDGADLLLEAVLGNKIVDIPAKLLIENNYLVKPVIKFLKVPKWQGPKRAKYPTVYKEYITENDERNQMVVKGAVKLVEQGFVPLVLFHSIKHGEILYDLMQKELPCGLLSGKDSISKRDSIRNDLETNKISCILASKIFDIGIDIPKLSGLICAGAGKSSVRALQRIGRVIRKYPGKEMSAIIDFVDQAPYLYDHSLARRKIYESEFEVSWPHVKK